MLQHIALMNVVAPAAVYLLGLSSNERVGRWWPLATLMQLILIWGWHAPPLFNWAMSSTMLMLVMHLSLFAAAVWFWSAAFATSRSSRWQGIVAVLITGKLFCLLGALLTFAPRHLYGPVCQNGLCLANPQAASLADQQFAGSLMLIACPLTYVLVGTVMAARWFLSLEQDARTHG